MVAFERQLEGWMRTAQVTNWCKCILGSLLSLFLIADMCKKQRRSGCYFLGGSLANFAEHILGWGCSASSSPSPSQGLMVVAVNIDGLNCDLLLVFVFVFVLVIYSCWYLCLHLYLYFYLSQESGAGSRSHEY